MLVKIKDTLSGKIKVVSTNSLESLKKDSIAKFGYQIETICVDEDGAEIDDEEVFAELVETCKKEGRSVVFVGLRKNESLLNNKNLMLEIYDKKSLKSINFNKAWNEYNLKELLLKAKQAFGGDVERLALHDGLAEIDEEDDEVLKEVTKEHLDSGKNLKLVALRKEINDSVSKYSSASKEIKMEKEEIDEDDAFKNEIKFLKEQITEFKKLLIDNNNNEVSKIKTEVDEVSQMTFISTDMLKKEKSVENKLNREKETTRKLEEKLAQEKLNKLNSNLKTQEERRKQLQDELNKAKYETLISKEMSKAENDKLEAELLFIKMKQAKISKIFFDLKNAEKVDICFLVDCTGSMGSYINESKTVIHKIIDKLGKRFKNLALRCAFVGYRDHDDGQDRITVFPFNEDANNFKTFVTSISAKGGADQCEDVFGGLEEVTKLAWSNMSRVLFHIADAPCHGKRFHLDANDSHPDGDPRGLNIRSLLSDLISKNINYYFAEINDSTKKMIDEFDKELISMQGQEIKIVKLETADELLESVSASVTATIMTSKSLSMNTAHGRSIKKIIANPKFLENWSISNFQKHNVDFYKAEYSGTIDNIIEKNSLKFFKNTIDLWISPQPFAKGGLRFAYAALLNIGTADRPNLAKYVVKESIFEDPDYNTFKYYQDMIECQVIANFLAKEFQKVSKSSKSITFLDVDLIQSNLNGKTYTIEKFIDGKFSKWTNNAGIVNEEQYAATLNCFSHWTYQITNEYLIVSDLQGFENEKDQYILTDPAITCPDNLHRFSTTNLGIKGVKKFFESHQCNPICKIMKLIKHALQVLPDRNEGCETSLKFSTISK